MSFRGAAPNGNDSNFNVWRHDVSSPTNKNLDKKGHYSIWTLSRKDRDHFLGFIKTGPGLEPEPGLKLGPGFLNYKSFTCHNDSI